MYLVVVVQSILEPEDKAAHLVRLLGMTPTEARGHAVVALPRVVASRGAVDVALGLARQLAAHGMGAAVIGPDDVVPDARRFIARTLRVDDEGVSAVRKDGAAAQLSWGDVSAAILAARKPGRWSLDLVDGAGGILCAREGDTLFDGSGLPAGSRAALQALLHAVRQRSNARVDDRLTKPNAVPQVLGGFASLPQADDWAVRVVLQAHL